MSNLVVSTLSPRAAQRRTLRAARCALDARIQHRHARQLAERVRRRTDFQRARRIAFYWPSDGELDPRPLMQRALSAGTHCYLPVLAPVGRRQRRLWFVRWRPGEPLQPNRFGIPEPRVSSRRLCLAWQLDLLLVPLVGFDAACNRLGMGGGFYDRSLTFRCQRRHPRLIGIAHECQRLVHIDAQPWDIALDAVCTEQRCYQSSPR